MKEEGLKVEEEKEKECLYRRGSGGGEATTVEFITHTNWSNQLITKPIDINSYFMETTSNIALISSRIDVTGMQKEKREAGGRHYQTG